MQEEKGLYLYENPDNFPYFILKQIKFYSDSNIKDLKGEFVIQDEEVFNNLKDINFNKENYKEINLLEWKNGSLIFDYKAKKDNVLIIHDLWHPNWNVKKIHNVEGFDDKLNS